MSETILSILDLSPSEKLRLGLQPFRIQTEPRIGSQARLTCPHSGAEPINETSLTAPLEA